jgi:hypothetical protein
MAVAFIPLEAVPSFIEALLWAWIKDRELVLAPALEDTLSTKLLPYIAPVRIIEALGEIVTYPKSLGG